MNCKGYIKSSMLTILFLILSDLRPFIFPNFQYQTVRSTLIGPDYAIKKQRGGDFGCNELVLYGIRVLVEQLLGTVLDINHTDIEYI